MMQKRIITLWNKVHIYLKLDKDKNISGLSFEAKDAISLASASILTIL